MCFVIKNEIAKENVRFMCFSDLMKWCVYAKKKALLVNGTPATSVFVYRRNIRQFAHRIHKTHWALRCFGKHIQRCQEQSLTNAKCVCVCVFVVWEDWNAREVFVSVAATGSFALCTLRRTSHGCGAAIVKQHAAVLFISSFIHFPTSLVSSRIILEVAAPLPAANLSCVPTFSDYISLLLLRYEYIRKSGAKSYVLKNDCVSIAS